MFGLFGDLFDLNQDGEIDSFERAMEFVAFSEIVSESEDTDDDDDF